MPRAGDGEIEVTVNGQALACGGGRARDWLTASKLVPTDAPWVVAINGEHVSHEALAARKLAHGDSIEVLTIRQGG